MHEQCLYKFENEIAYDADKGKEMDKYYCPEHHPRKDDLLSDDDNDDDDDDDDDNNNNNNNNDDEVSPVKNSSRPTIPALPPLRKQRNNCDWNLSPTGCKVPSLPTIQCQRDGCARQVHHLCALEWEQSQGIEAPTISSYCRYHHPIFPTRYQMQLLPTGGDPSESSSEDLSDTDVQVGKDNNNNNVIPEVQDMDECEEPSDPNCENNNTNEDADDSDNCDNGNDSGDDGSEAEIHDAGAEFEDNENTIDNLYGVDFVPSLPGAPKDWQPPGPPENWVYQAPPGTPLENDIDNPGNWNLYSFAPRFNASKKYEGHFTPAGAKVLPKNKDGVRATDNWQFYYNGWVGDDFDKATYVRDDAAYGNMKPPSRKGSLDADVLLKHGLSADRMKDDPLFFYQMLFPICDPNKTGILNDDRMPYFSVAAVCTNIYAATMAEDQE